MGSELIPAYVRWAPVVLFPLLAVSVAWLTTRIVLALATGRIAADAHWSVQAREIWPARVLAAMGTVFQPGLWLVIALTYVPAFAALPRALVVIGVTCCAAWGSWASIARFERRAGITRAGLATWAKQKLAMLLLRYPHFVIAVSAAQLATGELETRTLAALGITTVGVIATMQGAGWIAARGLGLVRPASARLTSILERVTPHTPRPSASEADVGQANALALPMARRVVVTTAALEVLTDDELGAVLAHEVGHLSEPRRWLALRTVVAVAVVLPIVALGVMVRLYGPAGIVLCMTPMFLSLRLSQILGRRGEQHADAHARGEFPPEVFGRALEKLYRHNHMPAVLRGTRTHPDLYDRLLESGVTPDFPRPPPPRRSRQRVGSLVALAFGVVSYLLPGEIATVGASTKSLALVSLDATVPTMYSWLARQRFDLGDLDASALLYESAAREEPSDAYYPAMLALVLAHAARCGEASAAAARAQRLLSQLSAPSLWSNVRDATVAAEDCCKRATPGSCPDAAPADH